MIVVLSREAAADLEAIGDYIAETNPVRAIAVVRELRESCEGLAKMPERFALVPRYERFGIRRRVHGNYLIFYKFRSPVVEIVHILHAAMDYETVLFPAN